MEEQYKLDIHPHSRLNILTNEWVLVSPHRSKRPWNGKLEDPGGEQRPSYDADCYLCPTNTRADGTQNPAYKLGYVFKNDFAALMEDVPTFELADASLLHVRSEQGICKVISFTPDHSLTLPELREKEILEVINVWQQEFVALSNISWIKYIAIFENKGEIMGCSNPHPHGQIWAQGSIPNEITKECETQKNYYAINRRSLLSDYLKLEIEKKERIIIETEFFVALVPFWAIWPFETMVISKRHVNSIKFFSEEEKNDLAKILKLLTTKYDNLFNCSFPYSAGMHQAPVNSGDYPEWHWHMHFYPPLLRSASVKKFMVGYELLAGPQRDITPEVAAERLRTLPSVHYKNAELKK